MTRLTRRTLGLGASAATLAILLPGKRALAQAYPSQDIHFIVGFAPGSGPDLITRWIADKIKTLLNNRAIIVENRVGAGGNIATEYVARAKPNGYVVYVTGGSALAASGHLFKNPPVDVTKAFDSIATLARQPTLVAVATNSPHKTVGDLQAAIKGKGDKASFGTAFPTARVLGAMLRDSAGGKAVEVQYRTSADWINDLANGALDFGIIDAASGSGHARQGRIRILAVSTADRFPTMPEVQTLKEAGLDVDVAGWWAAYAPAGTPAPILDQLHAAFTAVVKSPEAKTFFNGIANEPWPMTRAQAHQAYLKEYKDWGEYVRIAKIEPQG
jgi:tripartite-type tricarboxylate transporter receptor subunit TctC